MLFKRKSKKDKLKARYRKLMEESFKLSSSNRSESDKKAAEADRVMKEIETLEISSK